MRARCTKVAVGTALECKCAGVFVLKQTVLKQFPPSATMETSLCVLAKGLLHPRALAYSDGWVAAAGQRYTETGGMWVVMAAYLPTSGSEMICVLDSKEKTLPSDAEPTSLAISDDKILAIALGSGGVRLYALSMPLSPLPTMATHLVHMPMQGTVTTSRWICPASMPHSLVLWSHSAAGDRIALMGNLPISLQIRELLKWPLNGIISMDASKSKWVVVLYNGPTEMGWKLHMLQLRDDGIFYAKTLDLSALDRPDCPPLKVPVSVAVGDELVVVGYKGAQDHDHSSTLQRLGSGMVEAFSLADGTMLTRRCLPRKSPTALSTSGARIMVGASAVPVGIGSEAGPSNLYAMIAARDETFTVCAGEPSHPYWHDGTVIIDKMCWCYIKSMCNPANGEILTVVAHAKIKVPSESSLAASQ